MNILWTHTSMINCRVHLRQHHLYEHTINSYQHDMPRPPLIQSVKSGKRHTKWRSHRSIHYFHTHFADNYIVHWKPAATAIQVTKYAKYVDRSPLCYSQHVRLVTECTDYRSESNATWAIHSMATATYHRVDLSNRSVTSIYRPFHMFLRWNSPGAGQGKKAKQSTVVGLLFSVLIRSHSDISVNHAADTHH